jgi:hypothetical protein
MIHVDFDPDAHPERLTEAQLQFWNAWKARAKAATDAVVDAWEKWRKDPNDDTFKRVFKSPALTSVWGELKDWLLINVFHNKCAYCETPVSRSVFHAEHYRPKGRVTANEGKVKITDEEGKELEHPGYFWLAFHWKNLLPSCTLCNTVNGKNSQFPIPEQKTYLSMLKGLSRGDRKTLREKIIRSLNWPNIYYLQPADLDSREGRLLLHPYFDDPRKCLTFNDFGEVKSTGSPEEKARGEWSIKVYNLDTGTLNAERLQAMEAADNSFTIAYRYHRSQGMSVDAARRRAKEDLAGYIEGKKPYSAAVLDFLKLSYPNYF